MNFGKQQDPSKRLFGLIAVVAFHVLLVYGLIVGLSRKNVEVVPPPIETTIIDEAAEQPEELPPPTPEFDLPPPPQFETPLLNIEPPPQAKAPPAPPPPPQPAAPAAQPAPVRAPVRVPPKIDLRNSPRACREPEYPSASIRLGETGTVQISLLIDTGGRVKTSRIDESSGHDRLDRATLNAFSRCKFIIGTVDGVPEESWFTMRYKWVVPE